ncbi:hypothetical protein PaG_04474 [Moesziomyces aphidis]|uniref:Autophagy-related protein 14 n=1 Tax=Moesziomyces aphidis TaxID=84754 RepID=W3VKV9_MOEAP|nr:hypothetical protein PaG_04474 [Moesziomyces aphidis]
MSSSSSTSSKPRSSRQDRLPQRHPARINTAPASSHRAHPPSRSDAAHPSLAQLRHASASKSSTSPHACHNCHQMDTCFYCDPCLSSRIAAHHNEIRRLSLAKDKARQSVEMLLSDRAHSEAVGAIPPSSSATQAIPSATLAMPAALPDPFSITASEATAADSPHSTLLLQPLVQLRARRAALSSRVQNIHQCIAHSQQSRLESQEALQEQQASIVLRKHNLAKSWSSLEGSSAVSSPSASQRARHANKSRWLTHPAADHIDTPLIFTDVYTHYERQDEAPPTDSPAEPVDLQLGAVITRSRLQLASLQAEATAISAELANARATLARDAFRLFSVSPPDSIQSLKTVVSPTPRSRRVNLSASSSVAQRISKLSERYMPGAFGLSQASLTHAAVADQASVASTSTDPSDSRHGSSKSSWSIAGLPLPLPSEVRRHPREDVNGAVTYAINLIQLLATYLGIALPFCIEQHKGRFSLRPDALWDGGGGSSAKTLYLSSRAYAHLSTTAPSTQRSSKLNNLAESTIGLGASTLSTIESYIHLPSGAGLPWGLTANQTPNSKNASGSHDADSEARQEARTDKGRDSALPSGGSSTDARSKPDQAARSFVSALVMLSYDVAYLAVKQGIQLDLVAAAANPLHLLSMIMRQSDLGRRAHANHISASGIADLSLHSLDYEQLAQILEPNNAAADGYKRGGSSRSARSDLAEAPRPRVAAGPHKMLEQSYVDVGEAAASVLGLRDPSTAARKPSARQASAAPAAQTGEAGQKMSKPQPAPRLAADDGRSQKRTASKRMPSTSAQPPPSLEFLRQRGRDASRAKGDAGPATAANHGSERKDRASKPSRQATVPEDEAGTQASRKIGPGAVIFNGVEVGVGNMSVDADRSAAGPSRGPREKHRKHATDEGWDLV